MLRSLLFFFFFFSKIYCSDDAIIKLFASPTTFEKSSGGHSSIRDPTSLQLEFPVSLKDARARVVSIYSDETLRSGITGFILSLNT